MNNDKSLHQTGVNCTGGGLYDYVDFICRELGYDVVVLTIAEPFRSLLADDNAEPVPSGRSYVARSSLTCERSRASQAADLFDPLAAVKHGYAFYVGLPLRLSSGAMVGTLAALARAAPPHATDELPKLKIFKNIVMQFLETLSARA